MGECKPEPSGDGKPFYRTVLGASLPLDFEKKLLETGSVEEAMGDKPSGKGKPKAQAQP